MKAGLGGRFWTLVHWTNWRVTFPLPPGHQAGVARRVMDELRRPARAAAGDQLADARAQPRRRRLRVSRGAGGRRVRRLGPQRPRPAGLVTFEAGDRHFHASRLYDTEPGVIRAFRMSYSWWLYERVLAVGGHGGGAGAAVVHAPAEPARPLPAAALVAAALPRVARLALARMVAGRAADWSAEQARVRANVARVLSPRQPGRARGAVGEVFRHFPRLLRRPHQHQPARGPARPPGRASRARALLAAAAEGRGVVLVTAHLGNWELGGRLLATRLRRTDPRRWRPRPIPASSASARRALAGALRAAGRPHRDGAAGGRAAAGRDRRAAGRSGARHPRGRPRGLLRRPGAVPARSLRAGARRRGARWCRPSACSTPTCATAS